jgi:hypothetical protein
MQRQCALSRIRVLKRDEHACLQMHMEGRFATFCKKRAFSGVLVNASPPPSASAEMAEHLEMAGKVRERNRTCRPARQQCLQNEHDRAHDAKCAQVDPLLQNLLHLCHQVTGNFLFINTFSGDCDVLSGDCDVLSRCWHA